MGKREAGKSVVVVGDDGAVVGVEGRPRYRQDGWTRARQDAFCAVLARNGSVVFACRAVGMSSTSAYKARDRMRGFAERWQEALATVRPMLEDAAYKRAVEGWEEPVFQGGRQVGVRKRYSDSLLRMMILRGTTIREPVDPPATMEQTDAAILKKLEAMARHEKAKARAAAIAYADDMVARGLAP